MGNVGMVIMVKDFISVLLLWKKFAILLAVNNEMMSLLQIEE